MNVLGLVLVMAQPQTAQMQMQANLTKLDNKIKALEVKLVNSGRIEAVKSARPKSIVTNARESTRKAQELRMSVYEK